MIDWICSKLLTVSPILSPEQDLTPGTNTPLRHVALNDKLSSSGTLNTSNSAFDLIFYRDKMHRVNNMLFSVL